MTMTIVALFIVLLHGYSGLDPSGLNWGVHHLGFIPSLLMITILCLMAAILNSRVQSGILSVLQRGIAFFEQRSRTSIIIIGSTGLVLLAALFWFGRQNTPFLGDGFLVFKALADLPHPSLIAQSSYHNEPFSALVLYYVYNLLPDIGIAIEAFRTYQVVSIFFGTATVILFWILSRSLFSSAIERSLSFAFLLVCGGSALFFGYIEDYTPLYWVITLFILLSVLYLQGKAPLVLAGVSYAFLFLFHLGMLILLPALCYLFFESIRRKNVLAVLLTVVSMLFVIVGGLYITGYTVQGLIGHFGTVSQVSFFQQDPMLESYAWYSPFHLLDVANLLLLLSPFALPLLIVAWVFFHNREFAKEGISIFLILAALGGLAFICGVNSLLGMSRDWDLFSSFGLPLCILSVYGWNRLVPDQHVRRRFLILMVGITLLHTMPWLIVNAYGEKSYKRFVMLADQRLWSNRAIAHAYDALGGYFYKYGNHRQALYYYLKYFQLDANNPRLLMNIGIAYAKLGDTLKSNMFIRRAADYGSTDEDVFYHTGVELERQNKPDEALYYLRRGLLLDSTSAVMNNEVGLILLRDKELIGEALPYLERAMRLDSNLAASYSNAALCYKYLDDTVRMNYCIEKYMQLKPDDTSILKLRSETKER
jgi:hypothetical protein